VHKKTECFLSCLVLHSRPSTSTHVFPKLPDSDAAIFGVFQLPGFDASILKRFGFLFSAFCLLYLRRQNPVVGNGAKMPEFMASKTGSAGFGLRRLDAAFMRPGLTGRGQWHANKQPENQAGRDGESSRAGTKRRQAAAVQKRWPEPAYRRAKCELSTWIQSYSVSPVKRLRNCTSGQKKVVRL
jgi:hypothetical protein